MNYYCRFLIVLLLLAILCLLSATPESIQTELIFNKPRVKTTHTIFLSNTSEARLAWLFKFMIWPYTKRNKKYFRICGVLGDEKTFIKNLSILVQRKAKNRIAQFRLININTQGVEQVIEKCHVLLVTFKDLRDEAQDYSLLYKSRKGVLRILYNKEYIDHETILLPNVEVWLKGAKKMTVFQDNIKKTGVMISSEIREIKFIEVE
jgi:hypothetical protein